MVEELSNDKNNGRSKEVYYKGEIACKFTGNLTSEKKYTRYCDLSLYNARVVKATKIGYPYHDVDESKNSFRCNQLPVRLYKGNQLEFSKVTLYNIRINNVEISKVTTDSGLNYGVLRGFIIATYIPEELKSEERLIGDLDGFSKGENLKTVQKTKLNKPIRNSTFIDEVDDFTSYSKEVSDFSYHKPWWSWFYFWNWFGSGCLGTIWSFVSFIIMFFLAINLMKSCKSNLKDFSSEDDIEATASDDVPTYEFSETDLSLNDDKEDDKNKELDTILKCNIIETNLKWINGFGKVNDIILPFCNEDVKEATFVRQKKNYKSFDEIYSNMISNDFSKLDKTILAYKHKARQNKLTATQLANLVVSSVQSMEYWIVHNGDHSEMKKYSTKYYEDYCLKEKCLPEINEFGVLSPLEFLKMKRGDCDSRTVFLYCVLNGLGINTKILNSTSHSIIAVAGVKPKQNDFIKINNKRYYVWETTSKGWQLGQFPKGGNEPLKSFKPVKLTKLKA